MRGKSLLLLLVLAGCSRGPEADLQYIKQARSVGAEWALVNEQANQGKLTGTYVRSMREWLRSDLQTTASSLTQPDSRYGEEIRTLLAQPDDAEPDELRAHVAVLELIEARLESA
jgi:Tfp pilus assembly protein PilP